MNRIMPMKKVHKNVKLVPEGERQCPICGKRMYIEKIKNISTDVCEDHGRKCK